MTELLVILATLAETQVLGIPELAASVQDWSGVATPTTTVYVERIYPRGIGRGVGRGVA